MITNKELRQIINDATGAKYIGKLSIDHEVMEGEDLWSALIYLDLEQTPLILGYQGTEEDFKKFVYDEMKSRKLQLVNFWKIRKVEPENFDDDKWYKDDE